MPSGFKFHSIVPAEWTQRTLCSCFFLMDQHSLLQCFWYIISLASLAYTFTILHTIKYSMQDHDNNNNTTSTGPQEHDLTNFSALSSTHETLATTSTLENIEKTNSQWTEHEVNLLLDYIETNCILMTAWGLNLKKSEFNKAWAIVKSKDMSQCHYKWGHVSIFIINEDFSYLSSIIAMYHIQSDLAVGQEVRKWVAWWLQCQCSNPRWKTGVWGVSKNTQGKKQ